MRLYVFFALAALAPLASQAEEAEPAKKSSILTITCEQCPAPKSTALTPEYRAPELSGTVQETTVRDVDGKKQIERAEQWLGGAPVRYVSHSPTFMPPEASVMATSDTTIEKPDDGVDDAATTSAVDAEALPLRN